MNGSSGLFDALVSLDATVATSGGNAGQLLADLLPHTCQILPFRRHALATIDADTFQPVIRLGDQTLAEALAEVAKLGLVALAVRENRSVLYDLPIGRLVLHGCATASHFSGIFIGLVDDAEAHDLRLTALDLMCTRIAAAHEHRLMVDELKGRQRHLEQVVADRSLDLALSREHHEVDSTSKVRFLANMSHEIRTPMNGVVGMIQVLLGTRLDPEQEDYARTVLRSGEALITILNDILDYSKIASGNLTLESIPFDPVELCYDVADLFRSRLTSGAVELVVRVGPDVPGQVTGDPTRIRQVLCNLVSNACKFTSRGHILLAIDVQPGPPSQLRFIVRDTGEGIASTALPRLFTPYNQEDASVNRRHGGTGLGLAISKSIIEATGGSISVESEKGRGTAFCVELPLVDPQPAEIAPPLLRSRRVLLVDDDGEARRVIRRQLEQLGAEVIEESDSQGAIAALAIAAALEAPLDAVLVDLHISGSGAADLVLAIRAQEGLGNPAMIVLAPTRPDDASRFESIATLLAKPCRLAALSRTLRKAMGERMDEVRRTDHKNHFSGRILLAEDNAVNQRVARLMLTHFGLEVDIVGDGEAAVTRAASGCYGLILMDLQMPLMDGFQATIAIRNGEAGTDRHVPIIALTAAAGSDDRVDAAVAGMDDYLTKPFREEDLRGVMERWLPEGSGRRSTIIVND